MLHEVLKLVMAHLESVNNDVVVTAWALIAKWCLMAAQQVVSGDSWVAFSVKAITEGEDEDLSRWLRQRLSSNLGAGLTTGSLAEAIGARAQGLPNVLVQFAAKRGKGVAMGLMVWGLLANPTTLQGGVGDGESKQGYSTEDIAALMEFACIHRGQDLPTIWDYFNKSKGKNINDCRRHITTRMKQWAYDRRIKIDKSIYLKQDTIKATVYLKFNLGKGVAHLSSASNGLSILTCRARTSAETERIREHEHAMEATEGTRQIDELLCLSKGITCVPAKNFWELKVNIATFMPRVVYQFGIFGWYLVCISWYLPIQYRRKTRLVHVGIIC